MPQAASLIGLSGKNPARTWKRWEVGERSPSIEHVALIEAVSEGAVTVESWAAVRREYIARSMQHKPEPSDSHVVVSQQAQGVDLSPKEISDRSLPADDVVVDVVDPLCTHRSDAA